MHLVSNTPIYTVNKYLCAIIGSNSSLVISHIRGRCLLRVLCAQIWIVLQGKSINSSKLCHWTDAQVKVFCKAVRRQPVWGPAVPPTRQVDYISAKKMWFTLLKRHTHTLPDTRRPLIHHQTWLDWFGRVLRRNCYNSTQQSLCSTTKTNLLIFILVGPGMVCIYALWLVGLPVSGPLQHKPNRRRPTLSERNEG